jgi:hypothetical protein
MLPQGVNDNKKTSLVWMDDLLFATVTTQDYGDLLS